ncbi:hypothetical protein CDL12_09827 [Handroanthus impetiginosus]|uniref:Uncharacterized protein n=1 Tax=Handroanthus impetiginosus TaxID=429701 RepID=A0A2G9HJ08_9LAMI|nr:hypothetical protein CDL12_09827 [Handroanthus impetiginosus]
MKQSWFENDDILTNILSRLPTKIVHRLKYVSKDWQNLTSNRSFIKHQLKRTEPVSGFFYQEIIKRIGDINEPIIYIPVGTENFKTWHTVLNFLPEKVFVLSSNSGLLCCRSILPSCRVSIYICNPLNKQWTSIKWSNCLSTRSSIALACDPIQNPIDVSTDFKLVAVSKGEDEQEPSFIFDVYSSKTGSWARSNERRQCDHKIKKNKGVFVEGILYWLTDGYQILAFDPQNELSWLVTAPLPTTHFSGVPETCIGESHGKLNYVMISEEGLQVWALEDHTASTWKLKTNISLDDLEQENPVVLYKILEKVANRVFKDMLAWFDPLAFKDGKLLVRVYLNIYLYDIGTRKLMKVLDDKQLGPNSLMDPVVLPYNMSLVPVEDQT